MNTNSIPAWHFVGNTLRDGKPVPANDEWLIHNGPIVMCKSGLHASRDPFDALQYASGATLCMVECALIVSEDSDKLVCRRRRIIKRADATGILREFARAQALSVAHLWDCPPVVRQYLETGDESLRDDARNAAWAASDGVAFAARVASDAVAFAAWAASDPTWAARDASDAACTAAWTARASTNAAWAAWDAARADFNRRVTELFTL